MESNYLNENSLKNRQLRQDLRVPTPFLVEVNLDNGRSVFGKLEDLSLNGAKLRLPVYLATDSILTLNLANHQFTIKGSCRWSIPHDWSIGSYLTGISFNEINPEQYVQLRQILFSLAG